jgi:acetone carboxylase, alpha subunit
MPSTNAAVERFLAQTVMFYGPDRGILADHSLAPRSPAEQRAMAQYADPHMIAVLRGKLEVVADEAFDQLKQTGAAPGAKWGDLIAGIFTASGDLAIVSSGGVLVFSVVCQPVVRYIMKYWLNEPTVGVRPGDIFMSNPNHTVSRAMHTVSSCRIPRTYLSPNWSSVCVDSVSN